MVLRETNEALHEDAPGPRDTETEAGFVAAGGEVDECLDARVLDFNVGGEGEKGVEQGFDGPGLTEEFAVVGVGTEVADFNAAWFDRGGRREVRGVWCEGSEGGREAAWVGGRGDTAHGGLRLKRGSSA